MRDLTSPDTFKDEMYNLKKYVNNRIITSDQVDEKNEEIDEWIKEQKADKTAVSFDIDGYQNPQELQQQQSFDNIQNSFNNSQEDDYDVLVESIRKSLSPHRKRTQVNNTSFGLNNNMNNDYEEHVIPILYWFKFASWGRLLNAYENKDLPDEKEQEDDNQNRPFTFDNQKSKDTETKDEKLTRLNVEEWSPYLFAGKIASLISILSLVMTILSIHPFWANPLYIFGLSVISLLFIIYQLNSKFNDGPLKGNLTFSTLGIQKYLHNQQVAAQKAKTQTENEDENNNGISRPFSSMTRRPSSFNNINDINEEDDDDNNVLIDDDDEPAITNPVITKPAATAAVTSPAETAIKTSSNGFPDAWGSADSKQELYHVGERFLKYCYEQRGKVKLNKPIEILKFFAPIIVSYNKSFASTITINRSSWEFKNIGYAVGKFYNELDSKFSKYGKHDKEYYYVINSIQQTALFYKVNLTLPLSIKPEQFLGNINKLINILKDNPEDDAVDVITEMAGRSGSIKIMRLNKKGFLPAVSTGDVLRFENMKTTTGKSLIKELSSPGDLKILFGLQNAERALVFDIGGHQNTNIAIDGFTGSGKTVSTTAWLDNILICHSPDEVGFIILDPKKGSAWQAFRYAPHVLGYFATEDMKKWPGITEMLRQIESARQDYMNNTVRMENYYEARKAFSKAEDWKRLMTVPRLIVVYDEMIDTLSSLQTLDAEKKTENKMIKERSEKKFAVYKDTFKTALGGLANVTREGGMTLMALSQRSDDNSMPRTYLASASIQFGMKTKYPQDLARLFSIDENKLPSNVTSLPTGSGYLAANGLPLTQLSTPIISGDPGFNTEVTKMIGLAWTILYSYDHDETKEPQGYFLDKGQIKDVYQLPKFSLFNRDKMYQRIKKELLNGDVHYANVPTDLSFNLDDRKDITNSDNNDTDNSNSVDTIANDSDMTNIDDNNNNAASHLTSSDPNEFNPVKDEELRNYEKDTIDNLAGQAEAEHEQRQESMPTLQPPLPSTNTKPISHESLGSLPTKTKVTSKPNNSIFDEKPAFKNYLAIQDYFEKNNKQAEDTNYLITMFGKPIYDAALRRNIITKMNGGQTYYIKKH